MDHWLIVDGDCWLLLTACWWEIGSKTNWQESERPRAKKGTKMNTSNSQRIESDSGRPSLNEGDWRWRLDRTKVNSSSNNNNINHRHSHFGAHDALDYPSLEWMAVIIAPTWRKRANHRSKYIRWWRRKWKKKFRLLLACLLACLTK